TKPLRRHRMKANRGGPLLVLALGLTIATGFHPLQLSAESKTRVSGSGTTALWSVQIDKVSAGGVNLEPSFQIAIYEGLLDELTKTKRFKQVFRDGDRNAANVPDLLILKTTVQKYTAGSETRRAVTTVSGATKLTVLSQLCTRDQKVVLERTINGNVRFM